MSTGSMDFYYWWFAYAPANTVKLKIATSVTNISTWTTPTSQIKSPKSQIQTEISTQTTP
jgi:hypothetical protein